VTCDVKCVTHVVYYLIFDDAGIALGASAPQYSAGSQVSYDFVCLMCDV
jgi:hypothetical protein